MQKCITYSWLLVTMCYIYQGHAANHPDYKIQATREGSWRFVNITCQTEPQSGLKVNAHYHTTHESTNELNRLRRAVFGDATSVTNALSNQFDSSSTSNQSLETQTHASPVSAGQPRDSLGHTEITDIREQAIQGSTQVHALLNCQRVRLLNQAVDASIQSLYLSSTGTLTLASDWLEPNSNLTILRLSSEHDVNFPENCSWIPESLRTLDISDFSVNTDFLSNCNLSIQELKVTGTGIETLELCVPKLTNLDVSWNRLMSLEFPDSCHNTSEVIELKISHNQLERWSSCGWPQLTHLIIDNNQLTELEFSSCISSELSVLKASHNQLTQIPDRLPSRLSVLDLSFNKINATSPLPKSVQILDLSHNNISIIGKTNFKWSWQLLTLDLSHNKLENIHGHDLSELHNLRMLDLSHNLIYHIRHEAFYSLQRLQTLNLAGNKLHRLDARLMVDLPKNLEFHVHNNPWRCSCHLMAALTTIIRTKCHPNCKTKSKLECKEGTNWFATSVILHRCLEAVQEVSDSANSQYGINDGSDEDLSEEKKEEVALVVIPGGVLIAVILLGAAVGSKVYFERQKIRRFFRNCFRGKPQTPETRRTWSSIESNGIADSDSETEV